MDPNLDDDHKDEIRTEIDALMQKAKTVHEWLLINHLAKGLGDDPPIHTNFNGLGWQASWADYDLGHPIGGGKSEIDAIQDLLDQEEE